MNSGRATPATSVSGAGQSPPELLTPLELLVAPLELLVALAVL